jgi:DNA-binding PadR family transcriptional regulator
MSEIPDQQGTGERESWETEIRRGVMQLFVLTLIKEKETYGYEIAQNIRKRTMGQLIMEEGTLYPALKRMEQNNWVTSRWERVGDKIRKYYSITPEGEAKLTEMVSFWNKLVSPLVTTIKSTVEIKEGTTNGKGVLDSSSGPTFFCQHCGNPVPNDANYCPTCGQPIMGREDKGGNQ